MNELFTSNTYKTASISPCGRYRWALTRKMGFDAPKIGWVMLNPSTADAAIDDPTIRRCIGFSRAWGYQEMTVANLFNWRATDPDELLTVLHPIAPAGQIERADWMLDWLGRTHETIVVAWGRVAKPITARAGVALNILKNSGATVMCLGRNKNGSPMHPLYLSKDLRLIPFAG